MPFVVNVDARKEELTEFWPECQGEVINGLYPLRRLLSGTGHSAVFATECTAQDVPNAAVKIVPAERVTLEQLSHWKTAADLSHPHMIRLFDAGLCQLGGRQFLFVVMEYAEQTLSEVLIQRALTAGEAQDLLPPTLDALAFLHRQSLVHGRLKPANFLVVNDLLKLSSDTVRPAGEARGSVTEPSPYDPPEAEGSTRSTADDIWALGMTMVEALTQRVPISSDKQSVTDGLPATLTPAFMDTIQRCLNRDPASRPTALELEAQLARIPPTSEAAVPRAVAHEVPAGALPPRNGRSPRALGSMVATLLVVVGAIWVGLHLLQNHRNLQHPAATSIRPSLPQSDHVPTAASQNPGTPVPEPDISAHVGSGKSRRSGPLSTAPVVGLSDRPAQPSADVALGVVHEQIPIVPRSALETIHGHVKVAVLVIVDPSGSVVDAHMENPGPSTYFARLAREAAIKWQFAAADTQDSRMWLVKFEFSRGGATVRADIKRP